MAKPKIDYEARFYVALRRILAYMTPEQLRRQAERNYGLDYEEALEMAYENVRGEAQAALAGYRRKKPTKRPQATNAVDPHAQLSGTPTPREGTSL